LPPSLKQEAVMNRARWTFAIFSLFVFASWMSAQPAAPERIDGLVRKLGSASFVQREQARKELETIGPAALDALRRAARTSDVETGRRLADLIGRFEEQLLTQQILAPKMIDLELDGVTVQAAIAARASKSGYAIQFQGDATPFADKKITLTGKMTFWEAFDRLCEQGGLMEMVDLSSTPQRAPAGPVMRGRKIVIGQPEPAPAGPILLRVRGNEKSQVSHAGSVKTEVRIKQSADYTKTKELDVILIVSTEPSLLNGAIAGRPAFAKLVDDKGRDLLSGVHANAAAQKMVYVDTAIWIDRGNNFFPPMQRFTQIRIKEEQAAKLVKEMSGELPLQVDLQNVLLARMDKVMDGAGKSVAGANGGTLKVQSVKKLPGDAIEILVTMENLIPSPFGNNIIVNGGNVMIRGNINGNIAINGGGVRVNGGGNGKDLPDLLDAKGQKFKVASIANDSFNFVNGSSTRSATIVFQANAGQAEPRELVVFGTRTHIIAVPFRFENLPLP
jgi:hypothetical protein